MGISSEPLRFKIKRIKDQAVYTALNFIYISDFP